MMAFPAQEPTYAGNAFLACARKALFRPTMTAYRPVGRNKTI